MDDQITITNDANEEDLFLQIRTAHRLLAAYYQRLLSTIEEITNSLELNFYAWEPSEYAKPCQFASNILERWQWDLLPANCTRYLFVDAESKNKIEVGKCMVLFHVISDSGILKSNWKSTTSQPDALDLPISIEKAQSVLRVQLYAPYQNRNAYWYDGLFAKSCEPNLTSEPDAQQVGGNVNAFISGFEVSLAELTSEHGVNNMVQRIDHYRDLLVKSAKALSNEMNGTIE